MATSTEPDAGTETLNSMQDELVRLNATAQAAYGTQETLNAQVWGRKGAGKTFLLKTARKPILLHSFDPGGSKVLMPEAQAGEVIIDRRFEHENDLAPTAAGLWRTEFNRINKLGIWPHLGTYVIDSMTTFSEAIFNQILLKNGKIGKKAGHEEWGSYLATMIRTFKLLAALPCDFIIPCHMKLAEDELGTSEAQLLIAGQSKYRVPTLFDEVWVLIANESSNGPAKRILLTDKYQRYPASTRIGVGRFDTQMPPDIKHMLRAANPDLGLATEDKPLTQELIDILAPAFDPKETD